ncbi:MAG: hypothetical protein JSV89_10725 [Spirochaetaceae bacterium]|nr:MAG: hypothetical protein JSV89_10725 [Spirochaetaceae bacterium]
MVTNQRSQLLRENKLYLLEAILPGIAHEINNNNQTIMLSSQVLLEVWQSLKKITDLYFEEHGDFSVGGLEYSAVSNELTDYYNNVLGSTEKIQQVTAEMRSFIRSDNSSDHDTIEVNGVIQSVVTLLANPIRRATDHLVLELTPSLPHIGGNVQNIEQIFLNMVFNACCSLTDRQQSIRISTHHNKKSHTVVCEIADQGRGINTDVLTRIRGFVSGRRPIPAEDLPGLISVLQILSEHSGIIDIQSEENRGTQVVLSFPEY